MAKTNMNRLETIKEMDRVFETLVKEANQIATRLFLSGKKYNYQALDAKDYIELEDWLKLIKSNKNLFNKLKREAKALRLALPFFNKILKEERWV